MPVLGPVGNNVDPRNVSAENESHCSSGWLYQWGTLGDKLWRHQNNSQSRSGTRNPIRDDSCTNRFMGVRKQFIGILNFVLFLSIFLMSFSPQGFAASLGCRANLQDKDLTVITLSNYLYTEKDRMTDDWIYQNKKLVTDSMPVENGRVYRGMALSIDVFTEILRSGMKAKNSRYGELRTAFQPSDSTLYSLRPDSYMDKPFLSTMFQIDVGNLRVGQNSGAGLDIQSDILPEQIVRIWIFDIGTQKYAELKREPK